jgi:hypothetical protein
VEFHVKNPTIGAHYFSPTRVAGVAHESDYGRKKGLTDVTGPRYRKAGKAKKSAILDEFCETTGYHRKYAITLLGHAGKTQLRRVGKETVKVTITARRHRKGVYQRFYDEAVERVVLAIWVFSTGFAAHGWSS